MKSWTPMKGCMNALVPKGKNPAFDGKKIVFNLLGRLWHYTFARNDHLPYDELNKDKRNYSLFLCWTPLQGWISYWQAKGREKSSVKFSKSSSWKHSTRISFNRSQETRSVYFCGATVGIWYCLTVAYIRFRCHLIIRLLLSFSPSQSPSLRQIDQSTLNLFLSVNNAFFSSLK